MKDYVNPSIRRKPDILVIHSGTNDITKDLDTIHNYQTIVNRIKKKSGKTKIVISSFVRRYDRPDFEEKMANFNMELKDFCEENLTYYMNDDNVDSSCV